MASRFFGTGYRRHSYTLRATSGQQLVRKAQRRYPPVAQLVPHAAALRLGGR
ncbi:MAG TPA: hypothetical protein VEP50_00045 [bacterium]|nr:hypothetical protein [bacterium]